MKKILLVNASPRAKGNSEIITQNLAEDLKDQRVVVFTMRDKDCRYCKACGACQGTEGQSCVQDDDITKLLPVIEACDAIVVATPIYNQQVSSLAKLFIERFYPWFDFSKKGMSNTAKYGKKAALVCSFWDSPKEEVKKYADWTVSGFCQIGAEQFQTLIFNHIPNAGDVANRPDYLEQVHQLACWLNE